MSPHPTPRTSPSWPAYCRLRWKGGRRIYKKRCVHVLGYIYVKIFHIQLSNIDILTYYICLSIAKLKSWFFHPTINIYLYIYIFVLNHLPQQIAHIQFYIIGLKFTFSKTCRFVGPRQEHPHDCETRKPQHKKCCFPKRISLRVTPTFFLPREAPWKQQCLHGANGLVGLSGLSRLTRHLG